MVRVALLGGSFNPPHVGHQMICLWTLATGRADQVWYVPCFQHAFNKRLVAFEERMAMCERAIAPLATDLVKVCGVERELPGPSRTLNTVVHLAQRHPEHRFALLIGADILLEKDSWYRFDEIERRFEIIVLGREGYASPPEAVVLPAISSTDVRDRLRRGEPVGHLVCAEVVAYIERRALYRDEGGGDA